MASEKRIPSATYRLQFNRQFTFEAATGLVDYLQRLGITDCYSSPVFQAGPESSHGYDVCRFEAISNVLGGEEAFRQFASNLKHAGMGLLVDMVPNHMGNDLSNEWWADVLKSGPHSRYASWFDIDWEGGRLRDKPQVLLPILEDRYSSVLEAGKLKVVRDKDAFALAHYDRHFPLNAQAQEAIQRRIPNPSDTKALEEGLRKLNGTPGDAQSFTDLDSIIANQHYRLAYWRVGPQEINYRRFFDITELVSMRMESAEVFAGTHELTFRLIGEGLITGLRIDHPDGLWNPKHYFDRLQANGPLYVVAEKILSGREPLPEDWAVDGTTGYDFLNQLNGIFVDTRAAAEFSRIYDEFAAVQPGRFQLLVFGCKRLVLECSFARETNALTSRLKRIAALTRYGRDFTYQELHRAISNLVVAFPVYRTYITESTAEVSEADRQAIEKAAADALLGDRTERHVLDFLKSLLLLRFPPDLDEPARQECRELIMRFQQLTGPVMAKGLEDTAFYRFNRLLSLNEVGGEPERFGVELEELHQFNSSKTQLWPNALLATATHDTKRGEDFRARLNVLSEMPGAWGAALQDWAAQNSNSRGSPGPHAAPDLNDEYFIYQTVLGAWPPNQTEPDSNFVDRVVACVRKSQKESKRHTSWTDPNPIYESATEEFIRHILLPSAQNAFLAGVRSFLAPLAYHGWINSISQTVLKVASPGVPDFYQGSDLWDFNMVDPDNRRPVDYAVRQRMLEELERNSASKSAKEHLSELMAYWHTGAVKLFTIWKLLNARRRNARLFRQGAYVPLQVSGAAARHVIAFARTHETGTVIVAVPRFSYTLMQGAEQPPIGACWKDTCLQIPQELGGNYRDVFAGVRHEAEQELRASDLFENFVAAALFRESGSTSQVGVARRTADEKQVGIDPAINGWQVA